jgi:hypothetical protein
VSDVPSTYEARGDIKRKKNRPFTIPTNAKRNSDDIIRGRSSPGSIVIGIRISIAGTAERAGQQLGRGLVERGNRIRGSPVSSFEASLLENLVRLDTMITEEVAKESSVIACLGARRRVVWLERIFHSVTGDCCLSCCGGRGSALSLCGVSG